MERNLGKDRILELYLNYAQWGRNVFGCEAASQIYYKVHCSELSLKQAVNLAAMLSSPGNSEPDEESDLMQRRRAVIEQNMKDGTILP
jgi:monofunctional biosynthetic peptidoglycan transglycosylase